MNTGARTHATCGATHLFVPKKFDVGLKVDAAQGQPETGDATGRIAELFRDAFKAYNWPLDNFLDRRPTDEARNRPGRPRKAAYDNAYHEIVELHRPIGEVFAEWKATADAADLVQPWKSFQNAIWYRKKKIGKKRLT